MTLSQPLSESGARLTDADILRELEPLVGKEIDRLIHAGAIRPVVGDVLPLERGAEAFRLLADRKAVGKVVLRIA